MTGKQKRPGEEQPAETSSPRQQMQDDGTSGPQNFGNIDPVEGEDPPGGNEVGGG